MKLISVKDLKEYLGSEVGSNQDRLLLSIIQQVSKRFETYMNRKLTETTTTEYFRGGAKNFFVQYWPIASSPAVVVTIEDAAQVENTDFWVQADRGLIEFGYQVSEGDPKSVAITYKGGYAATGGVLNVPDDLKGACRMQAAYQFKRKRSIGMSGVTMPDGSVSYQGRSGSGDPDKLLTEVENILKSYKRLSILGT